MRDVDVVGTAGCTGLTRSADPDCVTLYDFVPETEEDGTH